MNHAEHTAALTAVAHLITDDRIYVDTDTDDEGAVWAAKHAGAPIFFVREDRIARRVTFTTYWDDAGLNVVGVDND